MSEISLEVEGVDDFIGQETPSLEQAMRDPTASGLQPEHTSDLPGWVLPLNRFVDHSAQPPFQIKDYPFFPSYTYGTLHGMPTPTTSFEDSLCYRLLAYLHPDSHGQATHVA
jgi:hypothetical protein